jgi:hypothetical protein
MRNCYARIPAPVCIGLLFVVLLLICKLSSHTGPALTFSQMLFIAAQQLPSFVTWDTSLPRLKPRQVPISQWLLLVTTFASGTLLNNIVFAFNVPLTIQIIFRSAGTVPPLLLSSYSSRAELARRTRRVHVPRPHFHGEAIHAPTNSNALPHSSLAATPLLLTETLISLHLFTRLPLPSSRLESSSQPSRDPALIPLPYQYPPQTRLGTPLAS